jgi:hypothetical protein
LARGVSPSELLAFSEINATEQEIAGALDEVASATLMINDASLILSSFFGDFSDALGELDLTQHLPPGFTLVTEPTAFSLLGVGIILFGIAAGPRTFGFTLRRGKQGES